MTGEYINTISWSLHKHIDAVFRHFHVDVTFDNETWTGSCPIHGGDNPTSFKYYTDGRYGNTVWKCYSHHCEERYKPTTLGLVTGLLTNSYTSYRYEDNINFIESVKFGVKFLEQIGAELETYLYPVQSVRKISPQTKNANHNISRDIVRQRLIIPSKYYLQRGYSAEVLDEYDVGQCRWRNREMHDRVVFPVYWTDGTFIGCTGRSIFEKCSICRLHHNPAMMCPLGKHAAKRFAKWRHSKGFSVGRSLYNYPSAIEAIARSRVAIVVESPGNVLRLVESGVGNVVGVYGSSMSATQARMLEELRPLLIVSLGDNDDGGGHLNKVIRKRLPAIEHATEKVQTDVGDMSVNEILNHSLMQYASIRRVMV